jgi:CheY-like chemotaxis protein
VLGNRACPLAEKVVGRPRMMTSNVFGGIAAENLGYAKVVLEQAIARGDSGCRVVRSLPRVEHRTLPAVALTAFASARDRQRALAAGYGEHVPKPLGLDVLLGAVARLRARRSEGRNR